jgi:hypothetical protein
MVNPATGVCARGVDDSLVENFPRKPKRTRTELIVAAQNLKQAISILDQYIDAGSIAKDPKTGPGLATIKSNHVNCPTPDESAPAAKLAGDSRRRVEVIAENAGGNDAKGKLREKMTAARRLDGSRRGAARSVGKA